MNVKAKHSPRITKKWVADADLYHGKKRVRRGRPAKKTQTTIRISNEVLAFFRASGRGLANAYGRGAQAICGSSQAIKRNGRVLPPRIECVLSDTRRASD